MRLAGHSACAVCSGGLPKILLCGGMVMVIDLETLAKRLQRARVGAGLTQEAVSNALGVPRTAIVQIEAGNRSVSTLEMAKLADIYCLPIGDFFADTEPAEDALLALFRAEEGFQQNPEIQEEISRYVAICRAGVELERLLDMPARGGPPSYDMPQPTRTMEAVDQGSFVAEQERRRLRLGHTRIADMAKLVNDQGVWASGARLPNDMSGLFLRHPEIGLFILVNFGHVRARKRFSYAHEYAHALVDRSRTATVSLDGNRADLGEVRANAFAAAFLLPSGGVWEFLNARHKGGPSRAELPVYDPLLEQTGQSGVRAQRRSSPSSQELTFEDIAALAHHFGVSYQAALYRLKSLAVLTDKQFETLRRKEPFGRDYLRLLEMLDDLEGREESKPDREIVSQVLHLALEGYRSEEISQGKLRELSVLLAIPAHEILALADAA